MYRREDFQVRSHWTGMVQLKYLPTGEISQLYSEKEARNIISHALAGELRGTFPTSIQVSQQDIDDACKAEEIFGVDELERYADTKRKGKNKMEDQHRKIAGYRELDQAEIDAMNEVKAKGAELGEFVAKLRENPKFDQRWVSIGATDLQTGLMALTRAIAKPTFF